MTFQSIITRLFEESGLNKQEFAKEVGISRQRLYKYMEGTQTPTFDEALRIVRATGTKELILIEKWD